MASTHPYLSLSLPEDAPFELKPSPGKGWGVFATKDIIKGSRVLTEHTLFVIRKPAEHTTEADIWQALATLTPAEAAQFLSIVYTHEAPILGIFGLNCWYVPKIAVYGFFVLHSRINHSCLPNCKALTRAEEGLSATATRDILKGEEITTCYGTDFDRRVRSDRHRLLQFVCKYGRFFVDWDMSCGHDLEWNNEQSPFPIIVDRELRVTAEEGAIPVAARLVYNILALALLEEEGLDEDLRVARFKGEILDLIATLQSPGHAMIGSLAVGQKTWLEGFCTMNRLWGLEDSADGHLDIV